MTKLLLLVTWLATSGLLAVSGSELCARMGRHLLAHSCVLTPEAVVGPYYLPYHLVRSDVTEDRGGLPLELTITVTDVTKCEPLKNVTVDLWQADANGVYSSYEQTSNDQINGGGGPPGGDGPGGPGGPGGPPSSTTESSRVHRDHEYGPDGPPPPPPPPKHGRHHGPDGPPPKHHGHHHQDTEETQQNEGRNGAPPQGGGGGHAEPTDNSTFLRGIQFTNDQGQVSFKTIIPGPYPGRTLHIHIEVNTGSQVVHVAQLFFDESVKAQVIRTVAPYNNVSFTELTNDNDSIFEQSNGESTIVPLKLVDSGNIGRGFTGQIVLGVDPSTESTEV